MRRRPLGVMVRQSRTTSRLLGVGRGTLGTGCHWRSRGHEYCYRRWRAVGVVLTILGAASSAAAGSALLATAQAGTAWRVIAGVLGLLGAVLVASDRALGAQARADAHRRAASLFKGLRMQYYDLKSQQSSDSKEARERFDQIHADHMRAETEAEPLEGWADAKVTRERHQALERNSRTNKQRLDPSDEMEIKG